MTAPSSLTLLLQQRAAGLKPYVVLLFVLLGTIVIYAPMLSDWFLTDDFLFLHAFRDASPLGYVKDAFDFRHAPPAPEVRFYRPFHSSTFLALSRAFGLHAAWYHLWSLAVHLLNTSLVWLLVTRLTKRPLVAGLAATIFAVHPAYAPAVAWISNDNALMATSASLTSFVCFLKSEEPGGRRRLWYLGSVASYAASLLFHPEAGTLLFVIVAYRLLISTRGWQEAIHWRPWVDLAPFVVVAGLYAAIHLWMVSQDFLPQAQSFFIGWHMIKVYLGYFAMSVYPISSSEVSLSSVPQAVAAAAMLAGMALLLLSVGLTRRRPYVGAFAVFWFLASLLPLSTIDPFSVSVFGADVWGRKLYVAGPALAFLLALLLAPTVEALATSPQKAVRAGLVAAGVCILVLAGWRVVHYEEEVAVRAREAHQLITQLRQAHPTLPPGSRLYIAGAPFTLQVFSSAYLPSMVGLYYEDVHAFAVPEDEVPRPLAPGEIVFRYAPGEGGSP